MYNVNKFTSLDDLFLEEEAAAIVRTRAETDAEHAAWMALPPEERDRLNAEREAKYQASLLEDEADPDCIECWICGTQIDGHHDDDGSETCPDCQDEDEDEIE
jgi:hypothetical protein